MHYCDTSIILPLFFPEATSAAAEAFINRQRDLAVSPWVGVELGSVLNRKRRTEALSADLDQGVRDAYASLLGSGRVTLLATDASLFRRASDLLREDAPLRSADALHLAAADLHRATLVTSDRQLERAAHHHGVPCHAL